MLKLDMSKNMSGGLEVPSRVPNRKHRSAKLGIFKKLAMNACNAVAYVQGESHVRAASRDVAGSTAD